MTPDALSHYSAELKLILFDEMRTALKVIERDLGGIKREERTMAESFCLQRARDALAKAEAIK